MKSLEEEKRLKNLLKGAHIIYKEKNHQIIMAEKPSYCAGEGKTDIYVLLDNGEEIKISTKSTSADFLENKISAIRAEQIFGKDWSSILTNSISSIQNKFYEKQLYYPVKKGNIAAGSYTMGWRLDVINKNSGTLTCPIILTQQQKEEIFLGTALSDTKRHVKVNDLLVLNAGVANRILIDSEKYNSAQEIIDNLIAIENYSIDCYLTFRAVNYRSIENKIDGNRPLAVWVNWEEKEPKIIFDSPLKYGSKNDILKKFKEVYKL